MSFASKVNYVYGQLSQLDNKVKYTPMVTPKYEMEVRRLYSECHRLAYDANHLDETLRICRSRTPSIELQVRDMEKRIYLLKNEVEFVNRSWTNFRSWDLNPPKHSTIFSSPSNSEGSTASPVSNFTRNQMQTLTQQRYTCSNPSSQSSSSSSYFGSQGSSQGRFSGYGSHGYHPYNQNYPQTGNRSLTTGFNYQNWGCGWPGRIA